VAQDEPSTLMRLQQFYGGGFVRNASTAEKLAAVLISSLYGDSVLSQQSPLQVTDDGDRWTLSGKGYVPPRWQSGIKSLTIVISKADARVLDLRMEYQPKFSPEAERMAQEFLSNRIKGGDTG